MDKLFEFVSAVRYQRDLLEVAHSEDESAGYSSSRRRDKNGRLRQWLKQDKKRREYEWACENAEMTANANGQSLENWDYPPPPKRMDTRTRRILRRWPAPNHAPALSEAKTDGTYSMLAPLIIALADWHRILRRRYIANYDQDAEGYAQELPDWPEVECMHREAIKALLPHIGDAPSPAFREQTAASANTSQADNCQIPPDRRTKPMSLAEAGTILKLQPSHGTKADRRQAAAKAARRLVDSGGIRCEKIGSKFVFDKTQLPEG